MPEIDRNIIAQLALKRGGRLLLGHERIVLLELVAKHSSISAAAKEAGLSYKTAWEAVSAINNLLPTPAFITRPGGRSGGSAEVTPEGKRLIAAFHRLEERVTRISSLIAAEGLEEDRDDDLWTLGLKVSARNVFRCEVSQVRRWPVDVEVTLRASEDTQFMSTITNSAADELMLAPGRKVLALIKASLIKLHPPEATQLPKRNGFAGIVLKRVDAERNSEVWLDIGGGKTMIAVVPRSAAEEISIVEGGRLIATFDASKVILAAS